MFGHSNNDIETARNEKLLEDYVTADKDG